MRNVTRHYKAGGSPRVSDVVVHAAEGVARAEIDGRPAACEAVAAVRDGAAVSVTLASGPTRTRAVVVRDGDRVYVHVGGRAWRLASVVPRPGGAGDAKGGDDPFAASPMTGVVRKVLVEPGQKAAAGAPLFVVEAMKMEFSVTAPRDVVVAEVKCREGDRVDIQQVVVTFAGEAS